MTTHVFIVDSTTFKIHLEYLFAGTGSKGDEIDFNNSSDTSLHHTAEGNLISMIADGSRVRRGDNIIFYLQQESPKKIYEGKFFGIFKAKNDGSFLDNNDKHQYLKDDLNKSLTFRMLIEPYKVYAEGVTEWEALDEIKYIISPNQMLWSLIYRKLKGNRGNTMITIYEAERLKRLIRNKNERDELKCQNKMLSFDVEEQKITCLNKKPRNYAGRKEEINLLPRLIAKYHKKQSFEPHLQAYITQNLGKGTNKTLDNAILNGAMMEWLGNEVSCGVGMQRIDIMTSAIKNEQRILIPVELKAVHADEKNIVQIQRYVNWIEQYYIPNHQSDVQPALVAKKMDEKQSEAYQRIICSFEHFNAENKNHCEKLRYIEFDVDDGKLSFESIPY